MEDDSGGGGVGGEASSSSPIVLCGGGRQRFEVELRPGETTIVSWKKLMKDAEKAAKNNNENKSPSVSAASVPPVPVPVPVPVAANPALDSRIAPPSGETAENEGNDAPPGSRFSAVIEKIERLYMGKNSSDEEDLNDVPDDDEYDTEDSFIDDAELDDYFQVDNSAIKHDGFFVNRGKLERTNEPTALPTEQPKKRRRKDPTKGINENNIPNKQIKVNKKEGKKLVTSAEKNPTVPNVNSEDVKYQSPIIALGTVVKKPSDSTNPSPTRVFQGDAKVTVTAKTTDKQTTGILQSKKHVSKLKDGKPSNDVQSKSEGQIGNNSEDLNPSVSLKEKNVVHQQTDNKASEIAQTPKTVRKEGSSTKPKSTNLVLEKAISDLEKTVAETRPASMEVSEGDNSSQAVKRRMPPEIKQKLAKVARVAHGINGKVSKELLNRLMSIVGHLIQIRSLKRNLENMVVSGLSAKEEKNGKLQQLKKEVDEMVKIRVPLMKPDPGIGSSDDFQETVKTKFMTDDALEDKICDLYDLFVDGLDEDAGPHQLRKLYVELAELWPKGCMDNHGIKRAICRAKERKKTLFRHKDQEKMKRKKLVAPKAEVNPVSVADSITTVRSISNALAANITTRPPGPTTEKPKQDKLKGIISSSANNQNNTTVSEVLVKKKTKRKPDAELADGQTRPEKSNKQMAVKPTPTVAPPPQPQPQVVNNSSVDLV